MRQVPLSLPHNNLYRNCWCGSQCCQLVILSYSPHETVVFFGCGHGCIVREDAALLICYIQRMHYQEEEHSGTDIDDRPLPPSSKIKQRG